MSESPDQPDQINASGAPSGAATQNSAPNLEVDQQPEPPKKTPNTDKTASQAQKETLDAIKKGERIALIIAAIVAVGTIGQWITTYQNNASSSQQTERLIKSANRIVDAADSFSKSSSDMSRSFSDAVGKLGEQTQVSRDFATLTKKQFAKDQMPYLWTQPTQRNGSPLFLGIDGADMGFNAQKLRADVWIRNYGKSPAINVHTYGYISTKLPKPEADIDWNDFTTKGGGGVYPTGEAFLVSARSKDRVPLNFLSIPRDPYNVFFAIHILIKYSDLNGEHYTTEICEAMQGNGVPKLCNPQAAK